MALQDQIFEQLGSIQRTLGEVVATQRAMDERLTTQTQQLDDYQQVTTAAMNNALTRLGALENEVRGVKMTIDKTVRPLTTERLNFKQRAIGFVAAFTVMGTIAGSIFWFLTMGWGEIVKFFGRMNGG